MSRAQTYGENAPLGKSGRVVQIIARATQTLFGAIIAIILGCTIAQAHSYKAGWHHFWGFSCVMASASVLAAGSLCSGRVKSYSYFVVDGMFMIMWFIIGVTFGSAYFPFSEQKLPLNKDTTGPKFPTMRAVAVLSVIVMVAWICTFLMAIVQFTNVKKAIHSDARRMGISRGYNVYTGGAEPKFGGRAGIDWKQSILRWKLVSKD
ncbi:hypothetical protein FKW77_007694 [Venturia effusa]|uniref:MARVEL domain-containing protein n=1 Tax=Venturia effusa TaxID=50376 RepID=A0A517L1N3_9PEZI|nr:hypothetical protein FKW77_007694 [Venturia effusa]